MERNPHMKSKRAAGTQAGRHVQRHDSSIGLPSYSRPYNVARNVGDNKLTPEFRQSSSRRAVEEMSGRKKSRKIFRRLICFVGQGQGQSQQSRQDFQGQQQKRLSERNKHRDSSIKQQESSDYVNEDLDRPSPRISSRWNASMMPTKHELSVLERGLMEQLKESEESEGSSRQHGHTNYFRKLRLNPGSCLGGPLALWKPLSFGKRGGRKSKAPVVNEDIVSDMEREDDLVDARRRRRSLYIPSGERMQDSNMAVLSSDSKDLHTADVGLGSMSSIRGGSSFQAQRKKFSEMWKTTSNFQDLELVQSRMLGEILAISDSHGREDSQHCSSSGTVADPEAIGNSGSQIGSRSGSQNRDSRPWTVSPVFREDVNKTGRGRGPGLVTDFEIESEDVLNLSCLQAARNDVCGSAASAEIEALSYEPHWLLQREQSSTVCNDEAAVYDQVDIYLQELVRESTSEASPSLQYPKIHDLTASKSYEVADHASLDLVHSVSTEDYALSSLQHVKRYDAELAELRMQLQLLKMVSAAATYTLSPNSSYLTSLISDEAHIFGSQGWEAFYALDILIQSGFQISSFDICRTTWHTLDHPMSPRLFNYLEQRYSNEIFGMRHDRKLLFDRVNAALLDVFRKHMNVYPWVMPKLMGLQNSTWQVERVMEALNGLISRDAETRQVLEGALDKETGWWDCYKEEVDNVGKELEEFVVDELIEEYVIDKLIEEFLSDCSVGVSFL